MKPNGRISLLFIFMLIPMSYEFRVHSFDEIQMFKRNSFFFLQNENLIFRIVYSFCNSKLYMYQNKILKFFFFQTSIFHRRFFFSDKISFILLECFCIRLFWRYPKSNICCMSLKSHFSLMTFFQKQINDSVWYI